MTEKYRSLFELEVLVKYINNEVIQIAINKMFLGDSYVTFN